MASVTVRGLEVGFDRPVLRGVDLDVADGETVALLGPSGSGKSTLLRVVAGLVRPDAGTVRIGNTTVDDVAAHRRGVGVVFQDQALFPHLDVGDNVGFGLRMAKMPRTERAARVAEVLALVRLDGYARRDPATLSGGEAQRVAIARALAPAPSVVLLDEPFAALDQLLRESLLGELRALFDRLGVTVIAVTHDPTEAGALGSRVAVLSAGTIVQSGPAGEVLTTPRSMVVAGLVGQRNVTSGVVADGTVTTPWATFAAPGCADGPVGVLVRPDGITPTSPSAPTRATSGVVRALSFRAGSAFATVEVDGGVDLDVRADASWQVGTRVDLAVDPTAVVLLEP